jgi:hypothetical protein
MSSLRRLYPLIACGGVLLAVIAFVVGQLDSTAWFDVTISGYAAVDPVAEFALLSAGLAALALTAGMRAVGAPVGGWPERLMVVWALSTSLLALVPADAPAAVGTGLSVVAFLSLPVAAGLLVPRLGEDERWRGAARPMEWLALAGGLGVAVITYVALPGHQVMIGLVERLLLGVEIAVIGVLAVRLLQLSWGIAMDRVGRALTTRVTRVLG